MCLQRKNASCEVWAVLEDDSIPLLESEEQQNYVYETVYVAGNPRQSEAFEATLTVNSPRCKRLLDTEATRTFVTEDVTRGVAEITVQAGDKSCFCTCFVVPKGRTVLFGQKVTYQTAAIGTNRG